jgi:hypothetical protein
MPAVALGEGVEECDVDPGLRVGVRVELDDLDPIGVRPQHGSKAPNDDLVVVDDGEPNGHGVSVRPGVKIAPPPMGVYRVPVRTGIVPSSTQQEVTLMVILGLILLIIGLIASISILTIIGAILLVVGLILNLVPIGGTRRRYY